MTQAIALDASPDSEVTGENSAMKANANLKQRLKRPLPGGFGWLRVLACREAWRGGLAGGRGWRAVGGIHGI